MYLSGLVRFGSLFVLNRVNKEGLLILERDIDEGADTNLHVSTPKVRSRFPSKCVDLRTIYVVTCHRRTKHVVVPLRLWSVSYTAAIW